MVDHPRPTTDWVIVVPVKGTPDAKSRFGPGDHAALASAIARDTVEAALAATGVSDVIVVTSAEASASFDGTRALVLTEEEPAGLTFAVALGIKAALETGVPGRGVAVMLGDLPALLPTELAAALEAAGSVELAMVPDADGTGTTLITAAKGAAHAPAFGRDSNALHRAAGYVPLDIPVTSGLRTDVDTLAALRALEGRLGPRTASALGGSARSAPRESE